MSCYNHVTTMSVEISVVVPVYNSSGTMQALIDRLIQTFQKMAVSFEIILVEDRSTDDTWATLESIMSQKKYPFVRLVRMSRNFGQHYAIAAGIDLTQGNWVVVMDCDLQDQPEEIAKFYIKAREGFDIVLGSRVFRNDPFLKKLGSAAFYWVLSKLTGVEHDRSIANFGLYSSQVIKVIRQMREQIRYFPVMVRWVGFKVAKVEIAHAERTIGKTSYNFTKLFNLALQVILAHSDRPLRLTAQLGFLMSGAALCVAWTYFIMHFLGMIVVQGWASVMISVWFLSGVIVFVLGVAGLYIGKVFEQVKGRPLYIISDDSGESSK